MMRMIRGTAVAFLLGLLSTAGLADTETIYKWTDENGVVHYGELPPEGVDAELVTVDSAAPEDADDPYASVRRSPDDDQPSISEQRREERARRAEEQAQEDARLTAACAAHRDRLAQLVPRTNILLQSPDGTSRRLDDNERLAMIEESQNFVDESCADY